MVAPVSGPYTRIYSLKGPPNRYGYTPEWLNIKRTWYRQKKPYNLPLSFGLEQRRVVSFSDTDTAAYRSTSEVWYGFDQAVIDNTYARAYAKFVDKLHDTADMATNLAEHKQANEMVASRLVQLARFANAVRKLRFGDAAKALGLSRPPPLSRLKMGTGVMGRAWLEFHFGWAPLVGDISNGMKILTSGLPPFRVKAHHQVEYPVSSLTASSNHWYQSDTLYRDGWSVGSMVEVSNPNLWLANRLGLLNPLGLAWELVPFSFIVDWFVNLNDVLRSSSDFYGLNLVNPYRTELRSVIHTEAEAWEGRWSDGTYSGARSRRFQSEYVLCSRSPGLPGPVLRVRPIKALSWQRGLTASALLLQCIKR